MSIPGFPSVSPFISWQGEDRQTAREREGERERERDREREGEREKGEGEKGKGEEGGTEEMEREGERREERDGEGEREREREREMPRSRMTPSSTAFAGLEGRRCQARTSTVTTSGTRKISRLISSVAGLRDMSQMPE